MFAVPIDNTGLASFVPVRRQSGSSVGLQDFGFNVFGQKIRRPDEADDTDIGGTNIGQIAQTQIDPGQIEQAEVLAPGISGFIPDTPRLVDPDDPFAQDDPFEGAVVPTQETAPALINVSETIGNKISEIEGKIADVIETPFSFNPEEGLLGRGQFLGQEFDVARTAFEQAANQGLFSLLGPKAGVAVPFVDLVGKGLFSDEPIEGRDVVFAGATALSTLALGPIGPLIVQAIKGLISLFSDPDYDGEGSGPGGLGSPAGGAVDAAMGGLGIQFSEGPEYGFFTGLTDAGFEDSDQTAFTDDFSGFGTIGDIEAALSEAGMPSGDGPDAQGDVGDDAGSTACWVAGTQILMADNTYRNIEDLKIGDMVMSYPETKKTRRWNTPLEAKPIVSLLVDVHPEIWHLNNSMVSGTEWMIKSDGTAAIVQWLNVGDTVLGPDNNLVEIMRVEPAEGQLKKQVIYNFETKDNYTYIADGMRTIRGRAVRGEYAPSAGRVQQVIQTYLSGDTNSYEGSMKDEYNKKFNKIAA